MARALPFRRMRYHIDKPSAYEPPRHAHRYECNHPAYSRGTLYFRDGVGLVVIQQRYDPATWWEEIDPWLIEVIYSNAAFQEFFKGHAGRRSKGLFPTFTVRQVMWALRMKPLEKQPWETAHERKPI